MLNELIIIALNLKRNVNMKEDDRLSFNALPKTMYAPSYSDIWY